MLTLARRVVAALSLAGMIAALFRLRGSGGVPPQTGGWREITDADLT
jgi:alpha-beta hydrolase superfamily lysophospholipase